MLIASESCRLSDRGAPSPAFATARARPYEGVSGMRVTAGGGVAGDTGTAGGANFAAFGFVMREGFDFGSCARM